MPDTDTRMSITIDLTGRYVAQVGRSVEVREKALPEDDLVASFCPPERWGRKWAWQVEGPEDGDAQIVLIKKE